MNTVIFRCKSMTYDEYHHIEVPAAGYITCSCQGASWCSHIEATLVCGERAMVPPEDRLEADKAQVIARGRLHAPEDWKAVWRANRKWRGLPPRETKAMSILRGGRPVVSMEGRGKLRSQAEQIAQENQWEVVSSPSRGVLVHVTDRPDGNPRIEQARKLDILVLTHDEWPRIASIGHMLRSRMAGLLNPS